MQQESASLSEGIRIRDLQLLSFDAKEIDMNHLDHSSHYSREKIIFIII